MSMRPIPTLSNVTVCTVHHRSPRLLEIQLGRMRQHGWPAAVLVADNDSLPDESASLRRIARKHGACFGTTPKRISHGLGLDLLAGRVATPWILALDSDAWPVSDRWMEKLAAHVGGTDVLAGPRSIRRHVADPSRAFAEPYCMLVATDWYRTTGVRFADRWPEWDTGEELSIRAKERGDGIAWIPAAPAISWPGVVAAQAVCHIWFATRIEILSADFLSTTDGLDVPSHRAAVEAIFSAEEAWAAGAGPDPWKKIIEPAEDLC